MDTGPTTLRDPKLGELILRDPKLGEFRGSVGSRIKV